MKAASKIQNKQRSLGSYYTPLNIAQLLSDWAIRKSSDTVLEPGFGGCGFLEASISRLSLLGCSKPSTQLFGCDKDSDAFNYLNDLFGAIDLNKHFLNSDFMAVRPGDFIERKFDAVIGNPPYVSLHMMSIEQRAAAEKAMQEDSFLLDRKASLWAYFVLHALRFLKPGGRCAWVLPSSFLYTDYAAQIKAVIKPTFSKVISISLEERLFTGVGAKERTVILLAEGYGSTSGETAQEYHVATSAELSKLIRNFEFGVELRSQNTVLAHSRDSSAHLFDKLLSHESSSLLGDWLDVKIGIVTGANKYFIFNKSHADKWQLPYSARQSIFAKFNHATGLSLNDQDFEQLISQDLNCLLLNTEGKQETDPNVQAYLDSFPISEKEKNATFKKRAVWHQPDDGRIPHAFLSYMSHNGPRMVLNEANVTSTNTIHRVYFKEGVTSPKRRLIAISLLSSLSQLSAELIGRSYGSGVLKLEPSESRKVKVLMPTNIESKQILRTYKQIDKALRMGSLERAQAIADNFILSKVVEEKSIDNWTQLLKRELVRIRKMRMEPRQNNV